MFNGMNAKINHDIAIKKISLASSRHATNETKIENAVSTNTKYIISISINVITFSHQ